MIRFALDPDSIRRLWRWTIGVAFIGACIWIVAAGIEQMNADVQAQQPAERKLSVTLPAEQLVKWAILEAERELHGEARMRTVPGGDTSN